MKQLKPSKKIERPSIDEHDDGREFPGEKLRNLFSPYLNYFKLLESGDIDRNHPFLKKQEEICIKYLDDIKYWLQQIK